MKLFTILLILNIFLLLPAKSGENGQGVAPGGGTSGPNERLYWPAASALTARLRRLITAYQRSNRREQLRQEALNRPDGRRRRRRDFMPSIAMVTEAGGGTAYIQDGAGVFMAEGSPYMAKGSAYFAKGGQFIPEASPVMTASSLMADGAMYYKERRQRYLMPNLSLLLLFQLLLIVSFSVIAKPFLFSDGLGVRKRTSTVLCPLLAWSLTQSVRSLIGHSSELLPGWTRKQMKV